MNVILLDTYTIPLPNFSTSTRMRYIGIKQFSTKLRPPKPPLPTNLNHPEIPTHRVTYEYPPPPNRIKKPKESHAFKRHIPLVFAIGGLLWAGYAYYYFFGNRTSEQSILNPQKFTKFKITCKQQINDDLVLIEIAPKFHASKHLIESGGQLWNGKRIWSIQVKHPQIQIARNYTPLPLYFMHSSNTDPLLRMKGNSVDDGRMCILVKKYNDGEMSRYIHSLNLGDDIEVRGPFVDLKLEYFKDDLLPMRGPMLDVPSRMPADQYISTNNIAMFTAGTGITTVFQMLLSANPPKGVVDVHHSCRTLDDVPFQRFMLFLERCGRARFHLYVDGVNPLKLNDIPLPEIAEKVDAGKYSSALEQHINKQMDTRAETAIVCGPMGYVSYVAGGGELIGGLLGEKGWKSVYRMRDL